MIEYLQFMYWFVAIGSIINVLYTLLYILNSQDESLIDLVVSIILFPLLTFMTIILGSVIYGIYYFFQHIYTIIF